ncbi:MAG TPA: ABC-2 family transporter protein [Rugosimonospora sp.]|nr:ABC-2 family transporter protein [Rugosimonospora sp.]
MKGSPPTAIASLTRYLKLTIFFGGVGLHRLTAYRLDFMLGAGSFFVRVGTQAAVLMFIFRQVPVIEGWGYRQTLFLFGFSLIPRGLDHLFTDQLWEVGRKLVLTGDFHRYLIRPLGPLFGVLSERFLYPDGFGELLVGVAITGYAGHRLGLHLSPGQLLLLPLLILSGALIYAGIKLLLASAAFWTTTSMPAMAATYQASDFAAYPLEIYGTAVRRLLTWVLPFAFTSYAPVSYLLYGRTHLLVWTPLVVVVVLLLAAAAWSRGVRRYEMSGT